MAARTDLGSRYAARAAILIVTLALPATLQAHEHDAEEAGPIAKLSADFGTAACPQIRLDKSRQHRAGIRTERADNMVGTVSLPAKVVVDPRRELRVAAIQDGLIEPAGSGVSGLPLPGQIVKAGQVLAYLRPVLAQPDRRDVQVDLAGSDRDLFIGRLQIDRFKLDETQTQFDVKLPTPTIQILTDYRSAKARSSELRGVLQQPLPLIAPRAGVILRSPAVVGRVAQAGQTLFELSSPGTAAVAVDYIDEDIDASTVHSATTLDGRFLPLQFLYENYDAGLRQHRALYAIADEAAGVSVNQSLRLSASRHHPDAAWLTAPADAVVNRSGHDWVWVHEDGEQFAARRIPMRADSGPGDRTGAGPECRLAPGDRIVVSGVAALIAAAQLP